MGRTPFLSCRSSHHRLPHMNHPRATAPWRQPTHSRSQSWQQLTLECSHKTVCAQAMLEAKEWPWSSTKQCKGIEGKLHTKISPVAVTNRAPCQMHRVL